MKSVVIRCYVACMMVGILMSSCTENDTTAPPRTLRSDNPLRSMTDKAVDSILYNYTHSSNHAGMSFALLSADTIYYYNYGETKKANHQLPDTNTVYEIGSVTKTFIASLTVVWLQEHAIDINSPIAPYLPAELTTSLSLNNTPVTFKHLLTHTSGFPRIPNDLPFTPDPYKEYDSTKIFTYIKTHSLLRTPGTMPLSLADASENYYSNFAYGLLGIILEHAMKKSLEEILTQSLSVPLSLRTTTFRPSETISSISYPHSPSGPASYWHFSGMDGAGGLKSTVPDLCRYLKAHQEPSENSLLEKFLQKTHIPSVYIDGKELFGLGWEFTTNAAGTTIIVKDGGTGGFTAVIAFSKTLKKGIVYLANDRSDAAVTAAVDLLMYHLR